MTICIMVLHYVNTFSLSDLLNSDVMSWHKICPRHWHELCCVHAYTILAQVTIQCPSIRDFSVGHIVPLFITSFGEFRQHCADCNAFSSDLYITDYTKCGDQSSAIFCHRNVQGL